MGCRGCPGRGETVRLVSGGRRQGMNPTQSVPDDYPKVLIVYMGPPGKRPVVGVATGTRYGRHKGGDHFYVFREDARAQPELFRIITDAQANMLGIPGVPRTPSELRMPLVPSAPPVPSAPLVTRAQSVPRSAPPSVPEPSPRERFDALREAAHRELEQARAFVDRLDEEGTDDLAPATDVRLCAGCGKPLPAGAHHLRKYCDECRS